MKKFGWILLVIIWAGAENFTAYSQAIPLKDQLLNVAARSDSLTRMRPAEKLYLQFDKPYYAVGDTIWFKAYLLNTAYLTATDKSGILYIDLINDSSKTVKQYSVPLQAGLGWGNIGLDEEELTPGTYTLRTYTHWMRNFGDSGFFIKRFYIAGGEASWLVNKQVSTSMVNGNNMAGVKLQFSDMGKKPISNTTLQLEVLNGNKHLYKQAVQTDQAGVMDVNFKLPEKDAGLAIIAESETKDKKAVIPVTLNRPDEADVQFLPEGGSLIAGLPAHIGFKAIGQDGRGINVTGLITDNAQNPVAEFKSTHKGMGSFNLAVNEGERYTAKVKFANGIVKEFPLPPVKATGTILQVKNLAESDSVEVFAAATNDIAQPGNDYFLIGKARGIVCYAAVIGFHGNNYIKRKVAKSLFPSGITHFTLMDTKYQPLNERLTFIDHRDNLDIRITADKSIYRSTDSVALYIKVSDGSGRPVQGNFSLAVTDDAKVKTDSLNDESIITRMLLTSDLKGYIEQPGYYFSKSGEAWKALDNLLLTQGWIGYDWQQVVNPPVISYPPEREFTVKGRVLNAFNKPVKKAHVLLFSKSPAILMDTTTGNDGRFVFGHFPPVDTPLFVIKAVNKNGKSFNVGIVIEERTLPAIQNSNGPVNDPWYVNSDTTMVRYTEGKVLAMQQRNAGIGGHLLREVKISAKKIVKDSQNLNGPGNADIILDEKDLEKAGKKSLLQLLQENIKGFHEKWETVFTHDGSPNIVYEWYFVYDKPVVVLVDGIFVSSVVRPFAFEDFREYLESHSAEDIKGVEVMTSAKSVLNYSSRIRVPLNRFAFIEITTRSGHGPLIGNTPGMYLYKPLALSRPKQFYKPTYTVNDTASHAASQRSTIDWEPNIVTGINGKATVSFYSAAKPSTYTVTIEGADMNGSVGYGVKKIKINAKDKYP